MANTVDSLYESLRPDIFKMDFEPAYKDAILYLKGIIDGKIRPEKIEAAQARINELLDGKTIRSRRNEWRVRLSISWISFYQKATTEKFSWERVRLYLIISLIRQWPVITG